MRMRIYLSGPITGTGDGYARFRDAEIILQSHYPSADIINPFEMNSHLPADCDHDDFMAVSFAELGLCTHIYQMNGWRESRGCNQERGYAIAKNIQFLQPIRDDGGKLI